MNYKFLGRIEDPSQLNSLNGRELEDLCDELRDKILTVVSKNGGHLASNLGAVELTVALEKAFCRKNDDIIFDVGHQCYTHKLLTGRYPEFDTLRKENGISGFMRPNESRRDPVVTGHSSSSLSSAYGIAKAKLLSGVKGNTVAVIGDGALTGGMAYEALNSIGKDKTKVIIVLNDNNMSISKNVGSLSRHLRLIRIDPHYHRLKHRTELTLKKIPIVGEWLSKFIYGTKKFFKKLFYSYNIFESLGFSYLGPIDGHNLTQLSEAFDSAKQIHSSCVIHIVTKKGKGYEKAEQSPGMYHGVPPFDIKEGVKPPHDGFSAVFGKTLVKLAEEDGTVCAVTAAMQGGTGLSEFFKKFPDRSFDVGIAEQHAVTFSAGLAKGGMKPVFAVYSSFLQRGYDQILSDAAIAGLPVTLCIDRAGIVGDDGETHQGLYDVPFLSSIPGVKIYAPASYRELEYMLTARLKSPDGVAAIRYPRGGEPEVLREYDPSGKDFDVIGTGSTALVSYGTLTAELMAARNELAKSGVEAAVIKLNRIDNVGSELLGRLSEFESIYIFEEGEKSGGVGEKLLSELSLAEFSGHTHLSAISGFVLQAPISSARRKYGLDRGSIIKKVLENEVEKGWARN